MSAFLAIVVDTWRQSKQQVVFLILIGLLLFTAAVLIIVPKVHVDSKGNRALGMIFSHEPTEFLEEAWIRAYATTLMIQSGESINPFTPEGQEFQKSQKEAMNRAQAMAEDIPPYQRSVEMWIHIGANAIFTISMVLFIAACAGYFPNLLSAGAVDLVLAKPLSRGRILLGKYVGGLALYSVAIIATYLVIYVGLGLRTGVWHSKVFLAVPLQIYSAAVLFAILAWIGILGRSTALAMILGYFFYLVVDSALGALMMAQRLGTFEKIEWLDKIAETMRFLLPNFELLKGLSTASVLNIPAFEWSPILVAAMWLLLTLGLGYLRFRRADY